MGSSKSLTANTASGELHTCIHRGAATRTSSPPGAAQLLLLGLVLRGSGKRRGQQPCPSCPARARPLFRQAHRRRRPEQGPRAFGAGRALAAREKIPSRPNYAVHPCGLPARQPLQGRARPRYGRLSGPAAAALTVPGRPRPAAARAEGARPSQAGQRPLEGPRSQPRAAPPPAALAPREARPAELLATGRPGELGAAGSTGLLRGQRCGWASRRRARGGTERRLAVVPPSPAGAGRNKCCGALTGRVR